MGMSYSHAVLNLHQVECFVRCVDEGTMTAAAERMRLSQSAISLAVAGLEHALGAQLLVRRRSRGLVLTPAGRYFLPRARELLAHAEDVEAGVQAEGAELTGELLVGCFRTLAPYVLPPLLETFGAAHPRVRLEFIEGPLPELERSLRAGRCEIAVIYNLDVGSGIQVEPLYEVEQYVLLSPEHPLARDDQPIHLRDLADHDLVMLDIPPTEANSARIFADAGLVPRVRFTVSSYELLRSLVARNLGYGLLISRPAVDLSYEGRPLEVRPIADRMPSTAVSLAWAVGIRRTRRARAFAEHCHHQLPLILEPRTSTART